MSSSGSDSRGGGGGNKKPTDDKSRNNSSNHPTGSTAYLQHLLKYYNTEVSASAASVVCTATAFPLDSVKTRMQTYHYKGFIDCTLRTYRAEGFRGFFRGLAAPLATMTITRTTSVSIWSDCQKFYAGYIKAHTGFDVVKHVNTPGTYPTLTTMSSSFAAGATAGGIMTVFACPFELTKLSSQLSVLASEAKNCADPKKLAVAQSYRNKGTFKTMCNIVRHRGFTGLYTGFGMHLLRDSLGTGLYFATYESTKHALRTYGLTPGYAVSIAGGLSGLSSLVLIYPVDLAKSNYQRNALMCSKGEKVDPVKIQFFRRHMYRGMGVNIVRSCYVNAVFFSSLEYLKKRINALEERTAQ